VLIVNLDRTGSMGDWRVEIFNRLALLFGEAQKYLGQSLEIIFTGFGDLPLGDTFDVAPSGCGPELDSYLLVLGKEESGGGNDIESSEVPACWATSHLDTSTAKNVFYYTVTDEGFYERITYNALQYLPSATSGKQVFKDLKVRMNVITLLAQTRTCTSNSAIRRQWEDTLDGGSGEKSNVLLLNDARRVVDTILGTIAILVGQYNQFSVHLDSRQLPTQHGQANTQTVHTTLSRLAVPGDPKVKAGTGSLLMDMMDQHKK